jgi:hypothetical protein
MAEDIVQRLVASAAPTEAAASPPGSFLDIFVSHSAKDRDLAQELIGLLRAALSIPHDKIRCTSVPGYKLAVGAETDKEIRDEVLKSRVLVGLLTPASLNSTYVLFELGARWGPGLYLAPLLAKGATGGFLRGPISGFNALRADSEDDLHQFVGDLARELNVSSANAAFYNRQLKEVARISRDGDVFNRYDRCRVKVQGDHRLDQYFVYRRQLHYLDPEAAAVCDRAAWFCQVVEPEEEALLFSAIGEPFNGAQVGSILKAELGARRDS